MLGNETYCSLTTTVSALSQVSSWRNEPLRQTCMPREMDRRLLTSCTQNAGREKVGRGLGLHKHREKGEPYFTKQKRKQQDTRATLTPSAIRRRPASSHPRQNDGHCTRGAACAPVAFVHPTPRQQRSGPQIQSSSTPPRAPHQPATCRTQLPAHPTPARAHRLHATPHPLAVWSSPRPCVRSTRSWPLRRAGATPRA